MNEAQFFLRLELETQELKLKFSCKFDVMSRPEIASMMVRKFIIIHTSFCAIPPVLTSHYTTLFLWVKF